MAARELSTDQDVAFGKARDLPGPFFLTGRAGTGKSHLVRHIARLLPNVAVCATTGLAAQLIGGRTFHSFLSLHVEKGLVPSRKAIERMKATDYVICDEASMCSAPLWFNYERRCKEARHWPKLILVGDLLQLPPVKEAPLTAHPSWEATRILYLSVQHRQRDMEFIRLLDDVRCGKHTVELDDFIAARRTDKLPGDCVQLYAHRASAEAVNQERLRELPGELRWSDWELRKMTEDAKSGDLSRCRTQPKVFIKQKARVVMLNNDDKGRWVNGSSGTVAAIAKGGITVDLDSGERVVVEKIVEKVLNGDGKPCWEVSQYPVMLAWALTIHKAQGMTLDRVGVDLSLHFDDGQTYVALSRCKTPGGLFLIGQLGPLHVNEGLLEMYARFERTAMGDVVGRDEDASSGPLPTDEQADEFNEERYEGDDA